MSEVTFEQLRLAAAKANEEFLAVDAEHKACAAALEAVNKKWCEMSYARDKAERAVLEYIRASVGKSASRSD